MVRIGTCSWKYDSWRGLIYSDKTEINFLNEYSRHFNTVEVDQWFWSLFDKEVILPDPKVVENYKDSVPADFRFTIKVPNSISLTHYYNKNKFDTLKKNPYFLSPDLYYAFLDSLKCIKNNIGCLIIQFEYLNKEKMSSLSEFQNKLDDFFKEINYSTPPLAIEIRNPYYLNERYFEFLSERSIPHVFLEGYFMPPIIQIFKKYKGYLKSPVVIRLHGPDRSGIEQMSGKEWNRIIINRGEEIKNIAEIVKLLNDSGTDVYLNINNHYEGSAPLTIDRLKSFI